MHKLWSCQTRIKYIRVSLHSLIVREFGQVLTKFGGFGGKISINFFKLFDQFENGEECQAKPDFPGGK